MRSRSIFSEGKMMEHTTKILDQWNTKTTGGSGRLSLSDFELIQDPIHIQKTNYSALEVVDLIGRVTNNRSSSGPITGTTKIEASVYTSSAIYNNLTFRPDVGEVWTLDAASVTHSGGAGASIRTKLYLSDGGSYTIELGDESFAGNTNPFDPTAVFDGVKITNAVYLTAAITGQTGGDEETSTITMALTRVR